MDRACGARGHARAEREHARRAGGSDHRVPYRHHKQLPRRDGTRPGRQLMVRRGSSEGRIAEVNPTTGVVSEFATPTSRAFRWVSASDLTATCGSPSPPIAGKVGEINPSHARDQRVRRRRLTSSGPGGDRRLGPNWQRVVHRGRGPEHGRRDQPEHARASPSSRSRRRPAGPFGIAAGPDGERLVHGEGREQDRRDQPEHRRVIAERVRDRRRRRAMPNAIAPGPDGSALVHGAAHRQSAGHGARSLVAGHGDGRRVSRSGQSSSPDW